MLSNRGLGINAKQCLYSIYEGVIIVPIINIAEPWGMRSNERDKMNALEMKCFRSLVGASRKVTGI